MGKRKGSRRPPKASSPAVSYAAERAMARSEGRDPEAVPMPKALGSPPPGMSMPEPAPEVIARARAEGVAAERARVADLKAKRKRGQPTKYTPELAAEICAHIAEAKPLVKALALIEESGGPSIGNRTVWKWLAAHEDFRRNYARAREDQADVDADEIRVVVNRVIGEDVPDDKRLAHNEARVAIEALRWLAGKRKPKVYGDKLELFGDPDKPLYTEVRRTVVDPSPRQEG